MTHSVLLNSPSLRGAMTGQTPDPQQPASLAAQWLSVLRAAERSTPAGGATVKAPPRSEGSWAAADAPGRQAGTSTGSRGSAVALDSPPNLLLRLLLADAPAEHAAMTGRMESLSLDQGNVVAEPGERISHVYFPRDCGVSFIKILSDDRRIEVGTAGLEGMAGLAVFLGAESMPLLAVIQVAGRADRLPAAVFRELAIPGTALGRIMQRYVQYQFNQAAQSVACNWLHSINERCARWLLMTHDRAGRDEFRLTHEYLATMLGARRAGVSEAADALRRAGLIQYTRGKMAITDRAGLERASCECYASDVADYRRLFPGALAC